MVEVYILVSDASNLVNSSIVKACGPFIYSWKLICASVLKHAMSE